MATIAIVDDNLGSCELMQRLLRQVGHLAVYFAGGRGAVAFLHEVKPDLLVLDVKLPDMDGMDVLRAIRHDPSLQELPVVIYSGVFDVDVEAEAFRSGVSDFIVKGLDWRMLLDRIERLLPQDQM